MEIQAPSHQEMTELQSNSTLKLLLVEIGRAVSKTSKLIMIDLEYLFNRGETLAAKARLKFLNFRHKHKYSAATALISCRPSDAEDYLSSFISPRHYQFSCSSSPIVRRRRSKHRSHAYSYVIKRSSTHYYNGVHAAELTVDKALDINAKQKRGEMGCESPEIMELPGFGKSPPAARKLRVTDSPFSLREGKCGDERSGEVDRAAEEFIDKFYKELKMQRTTALALVAVRSHVDFRYY